jgi:hypothetical protein
MKSLISRIVIAGFAIAGIFAAEAQNRVVTADVPFGFYMGEAAMPAGAYEVDQLSQGLVLALRTRNAAKAITVWQITGKEYEAPRLVFNRYGDTYFLKAIWTGNGDTGYQLAGSKREKELASNGAAPVVAVIRLAIR